MALTVPPTVWCAGAEQVTRISPLAWAQLGVSLGIHREPKRSQEEEAMVAMMLWEGKALLGREWRYLSLAP